MSTLAPPTSLGTSVRRDVPAVEVRDLTKVFRRRDRRAGRFARQAPGRRSKDVTFTIDRGECVAILGQNGSGKSTLVRLLSTLLLDDGGEARIFGHDAFHDTRAIRTAREPRLGRGELLQEDVRVREPLVRGALLRHDAVGQTRRRSRRSSRRSASRPSAAASRWRTSRAACSRRSRSRARCSPRPCCSCSTSRQRGSTRARSSRCRSSSSEVRATHDATILLCTHDMAEAEALADRDRPARPRRAAVPRAGRGREAPLRRRDARAGVLRGDRPHVRGGARRRGRVPGGVRMTAVGSNVAQRARRTRRHRRAQRLSHEALLPVGRRVHGLDDREHAHDRVHRARGAALGRPQRTSSRRSCSSAR